MKELTLIPFIYSILFEEKYNEKTIDSAERAIVDMVLKHRDNQDSFIVETVKEDYKEYTVIKEYDENKKIIFSSAELKDYIGG